jgi:pimeloyl-[acyl-carrier protein] methyl ester esterase
LQFRYNQYYKEVNLSPMQNLYARSSNTTLILLPGLDGTEVFFAPLLNHLPASIEPLVITYPTSGPNDYESLLPLVLDKIKHLESFVIMGLSFGGPLALMVASHCASQVRGVILCASFATSPRPRLAWFRFALSTPVIALTRAIRRFRLLVPGYATNEFRRAKAMTWKRVNARELAARSRSALSVDVRPQLLKCSDRLMYMVCTQDEVISRASLNQILKIAPHTQVAEIEGPHFAIFTNPAQSASCIIDFINIK